MADPCRSAAAELACTAAPQFTVSVLFFGERTNQRDITHGHNVAFIYGEGHQLMADRKDGSQWSNYLWFGGQLVGMTRSGVLYQIDNDHLGRPELITNASKAVVWRSNNSPFGGMTPDSANTLTDFNVGFPGQYLDAESGLWYNMNRYYDAELGRYLQADPIGLAGGINPYVYGYGNPVSHIDRDGRHPILIVVGAGAIAGGVGNLIGTCWGGCSGKQAFQAFGIGAIGGAVAVAAAGTEAIGAVGVGAAAIIDTVLDLGFETGEIADVVLPNSPPDDSTKDICH